MSTSHALTSSAVRPEETIVIAIITEDLRRSVLQLLPRHTIAVDTAAFKGDMDALSGIVYENIRPKARTLKISRASHKPETQNWSPAGAHALRVYFLVSGCTGGWVQYISLS